MTTARAIDKRMKQAGHDKPAAILTIVSDDHNVHCLAEGDLDAWWASLDPVEKADVYEVHLEQQVVAEDNEPSERSLSIRCDLSSVLHEMQMTIDQLAQKFEELDRLYPGKLEVLDDLSRPHLSAPQPSTKGEHHDEQTV